MFNRFVFGKKGLILFAFIAVISTLQAQQSVLETHVIQGRKIHVYLPPNYESDKEFPVLYLLDGQNLFDAQQAYAGEWRVDESLDEIFLKTNKGFIAVGIENGGEDRIAEYTDVIHSKYNGGEAAYHAEFIINQVIPFVNKRYKTKKTPKQSLIGGSSLGGIMAMYLGINYPQYFGKILSFSPSIWFYEKPVEEIYTLNKSNKGQRFFIETGSLEGLDMTKVVEPLKLSLINQGVSPKNIHAEIIQNQNHNEAFWGAEFKKSILYLFEL